MYSSLIDIRRYSLEFQFRNYFLRCLRVSLKLGNYGFLCVKSLMVWLWLLVWLWWLWIAAFCYPTLAQDREGVDERYMGSSTEPLHLGYLVRRLRHGPLMTIKYRQAPFTRMWYWWLWLLGGCASCTSVKGSSTGECVRLLAKRCGYVRFSSFKENILKQDWNYEKGF